MTLHLGCIADDFTGATDLANNLVRAGLRVVQVNGVPGGRPWPADVDAVVVALKSRTIEPQAAVEASLAALDWLGKAGASQFYFKVCSTFDSTSRGNIGPVAEALAQALRATTVLVTPAFPDNGRTVFKGHLFVGDVLLSESGMQNHPLTPMTDANLVRVMQSQCRGRVGLIDHRVVARGAAAVAERLQAFTEEGVAFAIADATSNDDLLRLGRAVAGQRLVVAGSGLAIGLPQTFPRSAHGESLGAADQLPAKRGSKAVVAGSCSVATLAQIDAFAAAGHAIWRLDPADLHGDRAVDAVYGQAMAWYDAQRLEAPDRLCLFTSSASPERVREAQQRWGGQHLGEAIEQCLARIAVGLIQRDVGQLVVAGGETSGACVQALGVAQMRIGPQIDPGVPWCWARCEALAGQGIHLALKSGNFGARDFLMRAFDQI